MVINMFVVAVFADGFFGKDLPDIGLQNAGQYLGKRFGPPVSDEPPTWGRSVCAAHHYSYCLITNSSQGDSGKTETDPTLIY